MTIPSIGAFSPTSLSSSHVLVFFAIKKDELLDIKEI